MCIIEVESKYGYFVDRLCEAYEFREYEKSDSTAQSLPSSSFDYEFPSYTEEVFNICEALKVLNIPYAIQGIPMSLGSKYSFGKILHSV